MKFTAESFTNEEPTIVLEQNERTLKTYFKYPAPDPKDRVDDEYDFDENDKE